METKIFLRSLMETVHCGFCGLWRGGGAITSKVTSVLFFSFSIIMNTESEIVNIITEEDLLKTHKQERKDLQAKIQSLKKSIPKGDKKKKKEIGEEITKLEQELDAKQNSELLEFKSLNTTSTINDLGEPDLQQDNEIPPADVTRVSRAQKRRNKKAIDEKEREKRISEQMEKNKDGPRILEMSAIKDALNTMNLELYNIPADGNCLYCAINHQLEITGRETHSISELRKVTSKFMLENKDEFLPFMYNELDESEIVSEEQFKNYCKDVATTKLWGSQLELRALSNILMCPIKIIQANGPATIQGENFKGPELILTYHRHLYRLGEHYNSTQSATGGEDH